MTRSAMSCLHRRALRRDFSTQVFCHGTTDETFCLRAIDRKSQLVRVCPSGQTITDSPWHGRHRNAIGLSDIGCREYASVHSVQVAARSAWMILTRHSQMYSRGVHVREAVEDECRFVRNNATPERPGNGLGQVIMLSPWQDSDPIGASADPVQTAPRSEQTQLRRIDPEVASIAGRDVTVLLSRTFNQLVPDCHVL